MDDYIKSLIDRAADRLNRGDQASAHFALRKVLRKEPGNIAALILGAELSLRRGREVESENAIDKLFELRPETFDGILQQRLGNICFDIELLDRAAQLFELARKKKQLDRASLYRLGVCLFFLGEMRGAEKRFLECVDQAPRATAPHMQLGHIYKATNQTDRAVYHFKKFIALSSNEKGTGYWSLADIKSYTFSDEEIRKIRHELDLSQDDLPQTSALNFALGRAAEKKKDYSAAIGHYNTGNAIQAKLKPFDQGQYRRMIAGLCTVPAHEPPNSTGAYPVAILIVGLPRSGTTLLEQILSAHSRVQATDELPFLEKMSLRLEKNGHYAERLSTMTEEEELRLRQQYLTGARTYFKQDSDYFIDKYPGNFLYIGLAKRIMPEAIIIDARRDPRDVAISAYRQLFNVRNEFAASFDGIHEYYKGYLTIMDHWKSIYPGQIHTINYERLVRSPDEEIQFLLDFCGLESEPGCFKFYEQERPVTTPSVSQVTQPMFTTSIGQWQHFEKHAPEELARLGRLIETDRNGSDTAAEPTGSLPPAQ